LREKLTRRHCSTVSRRSRKALKAAEAQEALKKAEAAVDEKERRLRSAKDAATI
jgi:hypothetical protein